MTSQGTDGELKAKVAKTLGLQKGGLPGISKSAPANEHYYYFNDVEDYETEQIVVTQFINFEEELNAVMELIATERRKAAIEELKTASDKLDELHQGTLGAGYVHYGEMGEWFDERLAQYGVTDVAATDAIEESDVSNPQGEATLSQED